MSVSSNESQFVNTVLHDLKEWYMQDQSLWNIRDKFESRYLRSLSEMTFRPVFRPDLLTQNQLFSSLRHHWVDLRLEYEHLKRHLKRMMRAYEFDHSQLAGDEPGSDEKWNVLPVKMHGRWTELSKVTPLLTTLLRPHNNHVWNCFFSILSPGKSIPLHNGPSSSVLRYHLCLKAPKDYKRCFIEFPKAVPSGQKHSWQEGQDVVFDDVHYHQVKNDTNEERVVLFICFDRPDLDPEETMATITFHEFVKTLDWDIHSNVSKAVSKMLH